MSASAVEPITHEQINDDVELLGDSDGIATRKRMDVPRGSSPFQKGFGMNV